MHFLIVRRLTKSELGWFGAWRELNDETSRQRGINFDADVVERVFPTAMGEADINLSLRFRGDDGIKTEVHPLKRQHKNWRLVGDKIEDARYGSVAPGDLFLLVIDAIGETPECAFTTVHADSDLARFIMSCSQTSGLGRSGMIALHSSESGNLEQHLASHDLDLFGYPTVNTTTPRLADADDDGPLTEEDLWQPPVAAREVEAFSNIGHDLNIAVADLVDNSIEAGARNVEVTFPDPNEHGRILAISDDGNGMKPRELARAMRIGSSRDYSESDLGKYGLGLKAASLSQARVVAVASRTTATQTEILAWDKRRITETGEWKLLQPEFDDRRMGLLKDPLLDRPGTVVLWDDMTPPRNQRRKQGRNRGEAISAHGLELRLLARHLGKVFHRFIEGRARGKPKLNLTINGNEVEALDPLVGWHSETEPLETQSVRIPRGADEPDEIVEIHPVIVPGSKELETEEEREKAGFGDWQRSQGFYFYRNDRIIQDGGWCDLWIEDPHNQLLRVAVDLNGRLDRSFGINVAKMTAQPPAFFTTQVGPLLTDAKAKAKKRNSPAGRDARKRKPRVPVPQPSAQPPTSPAAGQPDPGTDTVPPASLPSGPVPETAGPTLQLVPLAGKGWRCRTDAIGNEVIELDASMSSAVSLHTAAAGSPAVTRALLPMLKALDISDQRAAVLTAWEALNG